MNQPLHAVLLLEDAAIDVPAVSRIVARALRVPKADASRLVRYARGTLLAGLEEGPAREIQAALEALSIRAVVRSEIERRALPPIQRIPYAELADEAFRVSRSSYVRETAPISWDAISFLSLGQIVEREVTLDFKESGEFRQMMMLSDESERRIFKERVVSNVLDRTRDPNRSAIDPDAGIPPEDPVDRVQRILDLVFEEPPARLRIDQHDFCFASVDASNSQSSRENFKRLVDGIATRAEGALRSAPLVRYLEDRSTGRDFFESLEEFERFTDWAWQIRPTSGEPA